MFTRLAMVTLAALLMLCAPARAATILHLPRASEISSLAVAPDGSAWFSVTGERVYGIGHATAQGRVHIYRIYEARPNGPLSAAYFFGWGVIAPDGKPWFAYNYGDDNHAVRADTQSSITRIGGLAAFPDAVSPDGTMWGFRPFGTVVHMRADGSLLGTIAIASCHDSFLTSMTVAADGAIWVADLLCDRVVRIAADGTTSAFPVPDAETLAPGPDDGMWFAGRDGLGRVDVTGAVTRYPASPAAPPFGAIATAPDGSAYYPASKCAVGHFGRTGALHTLTTPLVPTRIAFARDRSVWLAGRWTLIHTTLHQLRTHRSHCDVTPPKLRVSPSLRRPLRLSRLRATRGLLVDVDERAVLSAWIFFSADDTQILHVGGDWGPYHVRRAHQRIRIPISTHDLGVLARAIRAGHAVTASISIQALDAAYNETDAPAPEHRRVAVRLR